MCAARLGDLREREGDGIRMGQRVLVAGHAFVVLYYFEGLAVAGLAIAGHRVVGSGQRAGVPGIEPDGGDFFDQYAEGRHVVRSERQGQAEGEGEQ